MGAMASLEASVRDQITLYVEGYISADELNDRLPDTWTIDDAAEPSATDLVMRVIGHLAEYQNGARLEEELRQSLADYVSWSIDRSQLSSVTTQSGLEVRVRVAAGTPLLRWTLHPEHDARRLERGSGVVPERNRRRDEGTRGAGPWRRRAGSIKASPRRKRSH
jgi:hypothetical protein